MSFALLSKMMSLFQTAGSQITKAFYYTAVALRVYRPLCGFWCSIYIKITLESSPSGVLSMMVLKILYVESVFVQNFF